MPTSVHVTRDEPASEIYRQIFICDLRVQGTPTAGEMEEFVLALSGQLGMTILRGPITDEAPGKGQAAWQHWVTHPHQETTVKWEESGADAYAWTLTGYPGESLLLLTVSSCREFTRADVLSCLRKSFLVTSRVIRVLADDVMGDLN